MERMELTMEDGTKNIWRLAAILAGEPSVNAWARAVLEQTAERIIAENGQAAAVAGKALRADTGGGLPDAPPLGVHEPDEKAVRDRLDSIAAEPFEDAP